MARNILRKGRMHVEDEERIQRCTAFIEQEVEARDLTSALYSAKILDLNDRSEIDAGETRVGRVRRLLGLLIMRGPYAFHEFTKALKNEGYDHVVDQLQSSCGGAEAKRSVGNGDILDKNSSDDRLSTSDNKLGRIEELLDQLCQRVARLESRIDVPDMPDEEITDLKEQLSELKSDTIAQIRDLMKENVQKDVEIADLTALLEKKQKQLQQAEERIFELEDRIQELESHCNRYRKDIEHLKKQGGVQADKLQRQERKIHSQSVQLQKQEKKIGEQEKRLIKQEERMLEMKVENEKTIGEINLKMAEMTSVLKTVQSSMSDDGKIRVIGRNVPQQIRNRTKSKWKS